MSAIIWVARKWFGKSGTPAFFSDSILSLRLLIRSFFSVFIRSAFGRHGVPSDGACVYKFTSSWKTGHFVIDQKLHIERSWVK
jgi:hypothetical protein